MTPRILVVDDEAFNRELISAVFAGRGYDIVEAPDGEAGLRIAAESPYDVVVTDLYMPRMDGPQFIKALRSQSGAACQIVLYTATAPSSATMRDFMQLYGIRHAIVKPAEPSDIHRAVEAALSDARDASKEAI